MNTHPFLLSALVVLALPALQAETVIDVRDVVAGDVFADDTVVILHEDFYADSPRNSDSGLYYFDAGPDHDIRLTSDSPGYDLTMDDYSFGIRGNNLTLSGLGKVTIDQGPLYAKGNLVIEGNADFTYMSYPSGTSATTVEGGLSLIADKGDISFSTSRLDVHHVDRLEASEGRTITFQNTSIKRGASALIDTPLVFNEAQGSTGTIRLTENSYFSSYLDQQRDVILNQGTLVLDRSSITVASLQTNKDALLVIDDGIVDITTAGERRSVLKSTVVISNFGGIETRDFYQSDSSSHQLVFDGNTVMGKGSGTPYESLGFFRSQTITINAGTTFTSTNVAGEKFEDYPFELTNAISIMGMTLDFSQGFRIDLNTMLVLEFGGEPTDFAFKALFGGTINLVDDGVDYSAGNWLTEREFALLALNHDTHGKGTAEITGTFDGLTHNQQTAYGAWSLKEQEYEGVRMYSAVWTPLAQIPEPASVLVMIAGFAGLAWRRRG